MTSFRYYSISALNLSLSALSWFHSGEWILKALILYFGSALFLSLLTISAGREIEFLTEMTRLGPTSTTFFTFFSFFFPLMNLLRLPSKTPNASLSEYRVVILNDRLIFPTLMTCTLPVILSALSLPAFTRFILSHRFMVLTDGILRPNCNA